jgi:hypothetical protein
VPFPVFRNVRLGQQPPEVLKVLLMDKSIHGSLPLGQFAPSNIDQERHSCLSNFEQLEVIFRQRCPKSAQQRSFYNLGVELLCKGLNDAGSKPAFRLGKNAIGLSHSVVGDRKPVGKHVLRLKRLHRSL